MFVQVGPVVNVYLPKDRVTNAHQGYGFVEMKDEVDADYVSPPRSAIRATTNPSDRQR